MVTVFAKKVWRYKSEQKNQEFPKCALTQLNSLKDPTRSFSIHLSVSHRNVCCTANALNSHYSLWVVLSREGERCEWIKKIYINEISSLFCTTIHTQRTERNFFSSSRKHLVMNDDVNTIVMQSSENLNRICRASGYKGNFLSSSFFFLVWSAAPRFDGIIAGTMDNWKWKIYFIGFISSFFTFMCPPRSFFFCLIQSLVSAFSIWCALLCKKYFH